MKYILRTNTDSYLMHHGVKGMKWGVRKEQSGQVENAGQKKRGLSKGQKVALGVAAVAVTGAVLYKTGSFDKVAAAGRRAATRSRARKLGLKVIENPDYSSSELNRILANMNEIRNAGTTPRSNGQTVVRKSTNSLDDLPIRLRHAPNIQRGPTSGYAKDRFGETIYRTNSPKLANASKRLMTPLGAEFESAHSYHNKADKLSKDLFTNSVADVGKAASLKRSFDNKGDKAYAKHLSLWKKAKSKGELPRHYSTKKVPSLKSNRSSIRGQSAFDKLQSSMSYRNLTYADLEKLDLW